MAHSAVPAFKKIRHSIFRRAFLETDKNIRMTELTSIPDRMFFMGEDDVLHPFHLSLECKILLDLELLLYCRNTLYLICRLHQTLCFGLFPVYSVSKPFF